MLHTPPCSTFLHWLTPAKKNTFSSFTNIARQNVLLSPKGKWKEQRAHEKKHAMMMITWKMWCGEYVSGASMSYRSARTSKIVFFLHGFHIHNPQQFSPSFYRTTSSTGIIILCRRRKKWSIHITSFGHFSFFVLYIVEHRIVEKNVCTHDQQNQQNHFIFFSWFKIALYKKHCSPFVPHISLDRLGNK